MPMFGALGLRSAAFTSPGSAAKAWAQLAQESLPRAGPASRAPCIRSR